MFSPTPPLPFNLFARITAEGRCSRCYSKVLPTGCPNQSCEMSPMMPRVYVYPVGRIDEAETT